MELNTVAECDVALTCYDTQLGDHRREYEEATKMSIEYTQKANLAWNQLCITQNAMREIESRKKELCDTNQTESKLSSANSFPSNGANAVVEDYARPANMCVKVARTLND